MTALPPHLLHLPPPSKRATGFWTDIYPAVLHGMWNDNQCMFPAELFLLNITSTDEWKGNISFIIQRTSRKSQKSLQIYHCLWKHIAMIQILKMLCFLHPSLKSHLNSVSPVLVYIQFKAARLKIALMTHTMHFPRERLWAYKCLSPTGNSQLMPEMGTFSYQAHSQLT